MDSSTTLGSVPFLKRDAIISVQLGTHIISQLQVALSELTAGIDVPALTDRIQKGTITSPRDQAIVGVSTLLHHIYTIAQEQGHTEMRDVSINDLQ